MNTSKFPDPPVHFLAAMLVVTLDVLWTFLEAGATITVFGLLFVPFLAMALSGLTFLSVSLIQYYLVGDPAGQAMTKGLVMGIFAGVPYPVMGTLIGVPLVAWAGLKQISNTNQPQPETNVITVQESE